MASPQGDVLLEPTNDGGDLVLTKNTADLLFTAGLNNATYISLFGGNLQDDGSVGNKKQYWGNLIAATDSEKIRSKTQHLLQSLPLTIANLKKIEGAVNADLQWLLNENIANAIEVSATIPGVNTIAISITISADGFEDQFNYVKNWRGSV